MTITPRVEGTSRRHPRRRRSHALRVVAVLLAAVVVFGLGAALGAALQSSPSAPGGAHTYVRTYAPLPPAPIPSTVTVTSTGP